MVKSLVKTSRGTNFLADEKRTSVGHVASFKPKHQIGRERDLFAHNDIYSYPGRAGEPGATS